MNQRDIVAASLGLTLGLGAGGGIAYAQWRSSTTSSTYARTAIMAFKVSNVSTDVNLHSNPDDITEYTLPVADIVATLQENRPAWAKLTIDATARGKVNVSYQVTNPHTSFTDSPPIILTVYPAARDTNCEMAIFAGYLYGRPLVEWFSDDDWNNSGHILEYGSLTPDADNWYDVSETYCLAFTLKAPVVAHTNTATVTATGPGGEALTAEDSWEGIFTGFDYSPFLADLPTVIKFIPTYSR